MATVDLYMVPPSSPCRAVIMTAKHINVPYNVKMVDLMNGEHTKPEFAKMNPMQTIPVLHDNGINIFESRAIMKYLVDKFAPGNQLYPKEPKDRAKVDQVLEFDSGTLYIAFRNYFVPWYLSGIKPTPEQKNDFAKALKLLEELLSRNTYVADSHLTLADLSIFSELTYTELANFDYGSYPKIKKWIARLKKDLVYHKEVNVDSMDSFRKFVMENINKK